MTGAELFDEVVALTGVSPVLAPGMIKRSLADGGVAVESAKPEDYEAALPKIKARLKAYVAPEEAEARATAIAARLVSLKAARMTPSAPLRRDRLEAGSGEREVSSAMRDLRVPSYDLSDTDTTLHGRRWTADEQAQLDALKRGPGGNKP